MGPSWFTFEHEIFVHKATNVVQPVAALFTSFYLYRVS